MSRIIRGSLALLLLILPTVALAAVQPGSVNEETVREIAAQLRCVVCQNLSVADSPSEMANQMRGIVRERLAVGETPEQVIAYFVEKYGEWILLSPRPYGFNLLVWTLPFAAILVGLFGIGLMTRRWSRRAAAASVDATAIDAETRERIRREVAELER